MDFKELAKQYEPYIIQQRRWFHRFPELTWEEYNTTDHIAAELEAMGLEVHRFEGITGCYAVLKGGKATEDSKVLVLRSDIDALPVLEKTGLPFASENEGVMHACGHDTHMSMLLGAAKILTAMKEELQGTVRFLFQPAEEVAQGAIAVIKQGILDGADAPHGQLRPPGSGDRGRILPRQHSQRGSGRHRGSSGRHHEPADHRVPQYQSRASGHGHHRYHRGRPALQHHRQQSDDDRHGPRPL